MSKQYAIEELNDLKKTIEQEITRVEQFCRSSDRIEIYITGVDGMTKINNIINNLESMINNIQEKNDE